MWDANTFSKNPERLPAGPVAHKLMTALVAQMRIKAPMSHDHFSAHGAHIQAWASHNRSGSSAGQAAAMDRCLHSAGPAASGPREWGCNGERNWCGQQRSDETVLNKTDREARPAGQSNGQPSIPAGLTRPKP